MLALTRRLNEVIVINENIRVTVLESKNGRVKLGVDAPDGMPVDRLEIHCRKLTERAAAAKGTVGQSGAAK